MTVAHLFPARVQPDGRTYYRAYDHADAKLGDGWTYNPAMAHPDYFAEGAPEPLAAAQHDEQATPGWKPLSIISAVITDAPDPPPISEYRTTRREPVTPELPGTLTTADVLPARCTEYMHYPLPPASPRAPTKYGQWGWYQLPHPETGRPTGYPRATTVAKVLEDQSGLTKWKIRERAQQVLKLSRMDPATVIYTDPTGDTTAGEALASLDDAIASGKVFQIDSVLDMIDNVMGGADARELGECAHAWLEALCLGLVLLKDVPPVVRPHITHAHRVIAHRGLVMVPEYCERTVLNDQADRATAGRIDCIFRILTTGELVLGDVKTNKSLEYSWLPYGVQIGGVYGWATKMLTIDGTGWEPMPEIREDFAILLHIPSNQPDQTAAITIDKWWGGEVYVESLSTQVRRKEAPKQVPRHALPVPSKAAIRYAEARLALTHIETAEDGQRVYETYSDVWDDELNEFGGVVAELL